MKALLWVALALLPVIAAGCGADRFVPEPETAAPAAISSPATTPAPESTTSLTGPAYPGGLSIPEAEALVRSWYAQDKPDLNPQVTTPLVELTTQEIWSRLGVQVFQVNGDIFQYDTFLIREGMVRPLGTGFGGTGVNSLAVTDLDEDGQPELAFTYSFGSGIHQARLGLYSPTLPEQPVIESSLAFRGGDLHLEKLDDQQVNVLASLPSQQPVQIGELVLQPGAPRPFLDLDLRIGIPAEVVEGLFTPPDLEEGTPIPVSSTWPTYTDQKAGPSAFRLPMKNWPRSAIAWRAKRSTGTASWCCMGYRQAGCRSTLPEPISCC